MARSTLLTLAALSGLGVGLCARDAAAQSNDTSGFTFQPGPGLTVIWRPYAEVETGYDSNLDNEVNGEGSWFEKLETGGSLKATREGQTYYFTFKARDAHFNDLDVSNRWEIKTSADATFDLSDTDTLNFTAAYHRDFFSIDRANVYSSDAEYSRRTDDYRFRFQVRSTVEQNLSSEPQGNDSLDVFQATRGEAYDFSRTEGYTTLLTNTRGVLQPFVIYDLAWLDYFGQVSNPLIDRNALDQHGVAGLRFQPSESFRVDLGARANYRDFEDSVTTDFTSVYPDVNIYWQPMDTVKVTALLERVIKEPSTSFGLADDVRTVGMTFDWNVTPTWLLSMAGYYDRVEAIGDTLQFNKYLSTVSLTHFPNDHLEVFLSLMGKWSDEEVTGDSYDRYKAGLGAKIRF